MHNQYEEDIEKWMPLINKLARNFKNRISESEDLINEGIIALIQALNSYSPNNGAKEGYIHNKIMDAIYRSAINNSFAVHVPSGSFRLIEKDYERIKNLKGVKFEDFISLSEFSPEIIDIEDIINRYDRDGMARLYWLEDMNYEEISKKTGYSLATISRHINNVREFIRHKCT